MPVDRIALNDALTTALALIGFTRISDDDLNDLTHTVADRLDEIDREND